MAQLIQPLEVVQAFASRPADIRLDKNLVEPHIQDAEYRWVMPALGEYFYNALATEKGDTSAFSTAEYQTLWDTHLKSLCATSTLYEASPYMVLQAGTNGLYLIDGDYGQNAGIDGLKFYQDTLKQRIELKQKRMKDWLCASAANLTDFVPSAIGCPETDCACEETTDIYNSLGFVL